ncbi:DUF7312 domain-containing protein [Halalkalicoccus tibetensis]|uniref:DUF7312 domain-containing protein n=1 Tax=Halalkalicoccus tibetensis TaxID=175632 RepID=A0ABD5V5K2_9EURY
MADQDGEDEWKYSIDEVGEDAEDAEDGGLLPDDADGDEIGGAGEDQRVDRRIEPGSLDPENVLFVVLGVLIAVGTIAYGLGFI